MGRRARTPFTLYQRNGWWWTQFVVQGKRHRISTASTDRGEASDRAAAIWQETKARAGEPAVPGAVTRPLEGIADDLLREAAGHGRAATYVRDLEVDLRLHILPRWQTPEAITSLSWEEAREEMHGPEMSWSSVKRVGKHLRTLLRFAKRKGAILSVPEIKSPPRELIAAEAKELEPFTRKERDALLADMRRRGNLKALRCYEVMFFNLFRKSTVERIVPSWIDWKKKTIRVPASKAKNSVTRTYWLHPRALAALRAQLKENHESDRAVERKLLERDVRKVRDRLVLGLRGPRPKAGLPDLRKASRPGQEGHAALNRPLFGKFDHSNVFWASCKRLGLVQTNAKGKIDRRGLTAHHVARRTAATLLVDAGVSTKDRMAAGGWESIEAAERYDLGEQVERSRRALRKLR